MLRTELSDMKKGSNTSASNEIKQLQSEQISEALRDHERRKSNLVITAWVTGEHKLMMIEPNF